MAKNWREMTNDELRGELKRIINSSNSPEQVKERAKDELGYPYNLAVAATYCGSMVMMMGMAFAQDGEILSF
jgi:hypothetical protein